MTKIINFPSSGHVKTLISKFNESGRIEDLLSVFQFCAKNNLDQLADLAELDIFHLDFSSNDSFIEYSKFIFNLSVEEDETNFVEQQVKETPGLPDEIMQAMDNYSDSLDKRRKYIEENVDRDYSDFFSFYDLYPVLKYVYPEESDPGVKVGEYIDQIYPEHSGPGVYLKNEDCRNERADG